MFTNWSAHHTEPQHDMVSGAWRVKSYRRPDGQMVENREVDEFLTYYAFVADRAAAGVASRRTSVKFVSGGTW